MSHLGHVEAIRMRLAEAALLEWKLPAGRERVWRPVWHLPFLHPLQRDPAGDPASAPGARAGLPAHPREGPAEPHAAGRAAAAEVSGDAASSYTLPR